MPLQIPHPSATIHLYRHLLREASYLPPLCRPYILDRIKSRTRDCRKKTDRKYVKEAHHGLRFLRSANSGHAERLRKLFLMATGRVGKRRRTLTNEYLQHHPATDSAAPDENTQSEGPAPPPADETARRQGRDRDWLDNWSIDKVEAIAFSQLEKQSNQWPLEMRRSIDPSRVIPTENSFGRPLTKRLARNKLKRHWVSVFKQLLPPMPDEEWDRLAVLSQGGGAPEDYRQPTRRPVAQPRFATPESPESPESPQWSWTRYVEKPARAVERRNSRKMKSLTGDEDQDPRGHGRPTDIRVLTGRKLQRIYSRLWEACPLIKPNPRTGKWKVTWGGSQVKVSPPSAKDHQFFAGVNPDGTRAAKPASSGTTG